MYVALLWVDYEAVEVVGAGETEEEAVRAGVASIQRLLDSGEYIHPMYREEMQAAVDRPDNLDIQKVPSAGA